tara:strand:+ start:225 stop:1106 length:882 start_codon:yes stop_codon:yes gene_type:complete
MDWNFVLNYLRKGDQCDAKFFGSISSRDEFGQTLVAMSNTKGGYIFIGVDVKNYHLNGTQIDRSWIDSIIQQSCTPKPLVDVSFVNKNDKVICVVQIKDVFQKPYFYNRKCYIMDDSNAKLSLLEQNSIEETFKSEDEEQQKPDEQINSKDLKDLTSELLELSDDMPTDELDFIDSKNDEDLTIDLMSGSNTIQTNDENSLKRSSNNSKKREITVDLNVKTKSDLNERQTLALEYLAEENFIKNKTYRELFDVSHKTAHLELVDLVTKHLIKSQGSGRSTCYVLNSTKQQRLL